jgi:hypothetical protein
MARSRVIFQVVGYLIAGFELSVVLYIVLQWMIEAGVKGHVPRRKWWERRPVLASIKAHRKLYPTSYLVTAMWCSVIAAIAFWIAGAYLQTVQKEELRDSKASQFQNK